MRALLLALMLAATPALAVQPDEILDDPELEARAREISEEIRCLVCRNEAIDDSNADLARDLRLLVRERLVAGDTDDEVKAYLVDRYGEYVLLNPPFSIANAAIWLAGPLLFLAGLGAAAVYVRGQSRGRGAPAAGPDQPLSEAERARLAAILSGEGGGREG